MPRPTSFRSASHPAAAPLRQHRRPRHRDHRHRPVALPATPPPDVPAGATPAPAPPSLQYHADTDEHTAGSSLPHAHNHRSHSSRSRTVPASVASRLHPWRPPAPTQPHSPKPPPPSPPDTATPDASAPVRTSAPKPPPADTRSEHLPCVLAGSQPLPRHSHAMPQRSASLPAPTEHWSPQSMQYPLPSLRVLHWQVFHSLKESLPASAQPLPRSPACRSTPYSAHRR